MRITDQSLSHLGELNFDRYIVKVPQINAWNRPNTASGKIGVLKKDESFYGLYRVKGEPINDIPIWIAHIRGGFIWIGGLDMVRYDFPLDNFNLPWYPKF